MTDGTEGPIAPGGLSLSPDHMRRLAAQATDHIIERMKALPDEAAWKGAGRAEMEALLREDPPLEGRPPEEVMERAVRDVLPVAGRVDHPRFFAFVPGGPTWPGVMGEYLAAGFNTFVGTWLGGAAPSMVELVVLDWFRQWIGYPETAGGLLTSGGSAASLDGFVAAREHAGYPRDAGVYMSDQSHTALLRAARIIGVRPHLVRMVPSDGRFRMDMAELEKMVAADRAGGINPIAVCANAGTTNTGAVDPMHAMADFCEAEGIWLHADAAYGGFAVLSDAGRQALSGLERADSIAMDCHKWLFQNFEAGCVMVKDVRTLENAFAVRPEYLQDTAWGQDHPNFGDRGLQLSRSFRALKIWMSIQSFGLNAFRDAVGRGIEYARRAEAWVKSSEVLQVANPASLGAVCFRVNPRGSDLPESVLERLNIQVQSRIVSDRIAMMASTRLRGVYSLRMCIVNHTTTWEDVRATLERIERFGREAVAKDMHTSSDPELQASQWKST